ncbi:MAG: cysteine--tRNA ligase [Mycobacteriales bacterium]|nr:cysteine--tRNA ligase [Frankia sp.]
MPLRLHDTLTRAPRAFEPLVAGEVGVYVCGITVQGPPHIGHARSAIAYDILRRWLLASGYAVTFVRNITDVDDKIINKAAAEHVSSWAIAERNSRAFMLAWDRLGILAPTVEPRATGHIPEMHALIQRLIDGRHAYPAGGDVYFDVASYPAYGALSGQRVGDMLSTEPDPGVAKRSPLDFALWKGHKPGEPWWDSPWGRGRPGWHLECSAMSTKYLGQPFDIHGGGQDLVFPHHENEVAQSVCSVESNDPASFARFWLHNGLVKTGGEKMSKSLGNFLLVDDVLETVRPQVLRYAVGSAHYHSAIELTPDAFVEAAAAYARLDGFVRRAVDTLGGVADAEALALEHPGEGAAWAAFTDAMDDDLGVPRALGVLHDQVTTGNTLLADNGDKLGIAAALDVVRRGLDVLGLEPVSQWPDAAGNLSGTVGALVEVALEQRAAARARQDFAAADEIRDRLQAAGVVVEDTPGGARWHLRDA